MKRTMKRFLSFFLANVLCLFCYGETKDDIMALYSKYRAVRSQAQLPYVRSPSAEPVVTEEMKRFYLGREVEIMMFHAYEPKSFVVEDDFEFLALEEDGTYQDGESTGKNYYLITNENVIEELSGKERRTKTMKARVAIWIREVDGKLYILGDPSLSSYYVRISDLQRQ